MLVELKNGYMCVSTTSLVSLDLMLVNNNNGFPATTQNLRFFLGISESTLQRTTKEKIRKKNCLVLSFPSFKKKLKYSFCSMLMNEHEAACLSTI